MVRARNDVIARAEAIEDGGRLPAEEKPEKRCDIYLALSGVPALRPVGFLVTGVESVNDLIAFCPLNPLRLTTESGARQELARQLRVAKDLAEHPGSAGEAADAIPLGHLGTVDRPAPHWIYGLSCIPLTRKWSGAYAHPTPFCATMLAAMASQPRAASWLKAQQQSEAP